MTESTAIRSDLTQARPDRFFQIEGIYFLLRYYRLLLVAPAAVGVLTFWLSIYMPDYLSVAFLRVDIDTAKTAIALMHSSPVTDRVLPKFATTGDTPEARRRFIDSHVSLVPLAPNLYRFGLTYRDRKGAQLMSSQMLDAWIEMTKPPAETREILQANLARAEQEAQTVDLLIAQLRKEATTLVSPNSLPGELATPIANLVTKRDQALLTAQTIRSQLRGVSPDAIAVPPDLPGEVRYQPWAIGLVAVLLSFLLLVGVLLVGRYLGFGGDRSGRRGDLVAKQSLTRT